MPADANSPAPQPAGIEILTPSEVARLFRVDLKTVARWADEEKLTSFRTPGGHRRYPADDVFQAIASTTVIGGQS